MSIQEPLIASTAWISSGSKYVRLYFPAHLEFGKIRSKPRIFGRATFIVGKDLLHASCRVPSELRIFGPTIPTFLLLYK